MPPPPQLDVPRGLESRLSAGHPWVYRDHVPPAFRAPAGTWVRVSAGRWSGFGLWHPDSPIAIRIFSSVALPDPTWVRERVQAAWELRVAVRRDTDAFRLLFGESDGLPGITVDVYGSFAVVVTYVEGLDQVVRWVVEALVAALPLSGVVLRPRPSEGTTRLEVLWGRPPPDRLIVAERGLRFHVDVRRGQKTGLFLDHRDNRRFIEECSDSKRVLNLFCYTGAFSLVAARGGAREITQVDSAAEAVAAARDNFELNGLCPDLHEFVTADVFEYMNSIEQRQFDLIVCDPPSFANNRRQLSRARRAYVRLNALCLSRLAPGGWLATASCTAQLGPDDFRQVLGEAAVRAKRRLQVIHEAGQPADHPVMTHHPEGRYLKFIVGRVLPVF